MASVRLAIWRSTISDPRRLARSRRPSPDLQESGLKGLILDIRFSPGGLLQSAQDVAELFLDEATVLTIHGRDSSEQAMKSDGKKKLGDFPLVVLVNEHTASAAEVLAGALKDNARAITRGHADIWQGLGAEH